MITLLLIAMLSMPVYAAEEHHTDEDIDILANIVWHEARGIEADVELACVAWTVCNRVDAGYGTLREVMTAPYQFAYVEGKDFDADDPVYARCREIAADVLDRWSREKNGEDEVGRVLPSEYLWYSGDGEHNYFRDAYIGGETWDYSLPDVYEEETTNGEETKSAQSTGDAGRRGTCGAPWSGVWREYGDGDLLHCSAGQARGHGGGTAGVLERGVRFVGIDYEGVCERIRSAGYAGEGIRD